MAAVGRSSLDWIDRMEKLFEIHDLKCSYDRNYREGVSRVVLRIDSLLLPRGKKIFIVGESGIGKSTILEVLGLMNNTMADTGHTVFHFYEKDGSEVDLLKMWDRNNDDELSEFRLKHFNFIFQSTNLMRNFTAYENIAITRMLQGYSRKDSFAKTSKVLADLGLGHVNEDRMAQELSGGQQQRLAFARAILPDFSVLFGDEPTGNLDSDNATRAMELLSDKLRELEGASAIIVSHDMHLAVSFADVIIKIRKESINRDGELCHCGIIDESCVFYPSEDKTEWSNGKDCYESNDFESYLRKI